MNTSALFSLNWADVGKGFLVAIIAAFVAAIEQSLQSGAMPTAAQLKTAGLVALAAGFSYVVKNFFTPAATVTPIVPASVDNSATAPIGGGTVGTTKP